MSHYRLTPNGVTELNVEVLPDEVISLFFLSLQQDTGTGRKIRSYKRYISESLQNTVELFGRSLDLPHLRCPVRTGVIETVDVPNIKSSVTS